MKSTRRAVRSRNSVGTLLSILRPTPLAFIAFFFSYALQVSTGNELFGLLPYILLVPSVAFYLLKTTSRVDCGRRAVSIANLDLFVSSFLALSTAHILAGILLGGYSLTDAARLLLIYVASSWVYFYASRSATESGIRSIMMAIAVATIVMSLQWVHETYNKMVKKEITQFQLLSYEYQKMRNKVTDEEMNPSALGTQYRAHGMGGSHPITGTLVAIGSFGALSLFPYGNRKRRIALLGLFFAVLMVGFATTAVISYALLFPLVLWLTGKDKEILGALKDAANVHSIKPGDFVAVTVFGPPAAASGKMATAETKGTVLTIRVKKSDIDSYAADKLDATKFKEKATIAAYLGNGYGLTSVNSWAKSGSLKMP